MFEKYKERKKEKKAKADAEYKVLGNKAREKGEAKIQRTRLWYRSRDCPHSGMPCVLERCVFWQETTSIVDFGNLSNENGPTELTFAGCRIKKGDLYVG